MKREIVMPKLGNTVESVIMVGWRKEVGEQVNVGDVLCEVETDKATMEVEAEEAGILLARLFDVGDEIPVLSRFAVLGEEGEEVSISLAPGAQHVGVDEPARQQSNDVTPSAPDISSVTSASPEASENAHISPRAWKLALSAGLSPHSLADSEGTGPGGRIIERDVRRALAKLPHSDVDSRRTDTDSYSVPDAQTASATYSPVYGSSMHASTGKSVQLTLNSSAPAGSILTWHQSFKSVPSGGQDVSISHLLMFSVARLLPRHPELNATFHGSEIRRYAHVNLGFAVDAPRGLMTPVIRGADRKSLYSLTAEARRLADACKEGHISPEELVGGTFTVTNLGALGIESFTPVLTSPEVAILGIGAITNSPIETETGIGIEKRISLSLSINLQAVDAALSARFLAQLVRVFARPERMVALY